RPHVDEIVVAPHVEHGNAGSLQHATDFGKTDPIGGRIRIVDTVAHIDNEVGMELLAHPARERCQQLRRGTAKPHVDVRAMVDVPPQSDTKGHRAPRRHTRHYSHYAAKFASE